MSLFLCIFKYNQRSKWSETLRSIENYIRNELNVRYQQYGISWDIRWKIRRYGYGRNSYRVQYDDIIVYPQQQQQQIIYVDQNGNRIQPQQPQQPQIIYVDQNGNQIQQPLLNNYQPAHTAEGQIYQ
eukprot:93077_1